jgi:hypothetical protein
MPFNKTRKSLDAASHLFDELDSFLTDLIVNRAPVRDRGSLSHFFAADANKPSRKSRARKGKGALAAA